MTYESAVTDEECAAVYHRQIRSTYRRNPNRYDCPTCGTKGALSAWQKQQGYHCDACTRACEQGY